MGKYHQWHRLHQKENRWEGGGIRSDNPSPGQLQGWKVWQVDWWRLSLAWLAQDTTLWSVSAFDEYRGCRGRGPSLPINILALSINRGGDKRGHPIARKENRARSASIDRSWYGSWRQSPSKRQRLNWCLFQCAYGCSVINDGDWVHESLLAHREGLGYKRRFFDLFRPDRAKWPKKDTRGCKACHTTKWATSQWTNG